jgi:hypothetical protein
LLQILLSKYGDLEALWAPGGASLQDSLLNLPLYAMQLLLASDKLKVSIMYSVILLGPDCGYLLVDCSMQGIPTAHNKAVV